MTAENYLEERATWYEVVEEDLIEPKHARIAIEMARSEMKEKAIEAFKFATDGYFIIGGTDYSGNRLKEFIEKLNS